MIYVPVPKEIKEYEKKVIQQLTFRQLFFTVCGCGAGIVTYFFTKDVLTNDIASYLVIMVAIPFMLLGWISIDDMPFDKFFKIWFNHFKHKQLLLYNNEIEYKRKGDKSEQRILFKKSKQRRNRRKIKEDF